MQQNQVPSPIPATSSGASAGHLFRGSKAAWKRKGTEYVPRGNRFQALTYHLYLGGEFLIRFARVETPAKKCAFSVTKDGTPVKVQRTLFSESYYTLAMNERWRVTEETRYQVCVWGMTTGCWA